MIVTNMSINICLDCFYKLANMSVKGSVCVGWVGGGGG